MKHFKLPAFLAVAILLPLASAFSAFAGQQTGTQEDTPETQRVIPQIRNRPTPNVNKQLVGWQEAGLGTSGERVGKTLRANWVMLNESDGIEGQIVGITSPIKVYLIRNGFVVGRTTTTANGQFDLESATPGPYTIVGYAREAIFGYSFNAVANDGEATGMPISIQSLPVTGASNNRTVARLLKEYAPNVNFREYGSYDIGEDKTDPSEYYGWSGLRNLTRPAVPATTIRNHNVSILTDGRFVGRVHQLNNRSGRPVEIQNTRVLIINEGEVIAEAQVDNAGVFEIPGLAPGSYGLVAIGTDGFAAIGLDLVNATESTEAADETALNADGYSPLFRTISTQDSVLETTESPVVFDACLCNPESIGWLNSHVAEQTYINAVNEPLPEMAGMGDMPYDYFDQSGMYADGGFGDFGGCGGGGGGGFGGGFGGGGGWLLPLGIAAIIAEAADDNDNNLNGGVRVISPFNP